MKIEKLTENKIRITLNLSDLEEEHIDLHSFMSNSAESQALFCSLLNKAEKEVGFYTKDYKLMIEAIAVPEGNFILTVTRLPEKEQVKKQLKIKNILIDDSCFHNIKIEVAYSILRDLKIAEEDLRTVYSQLISPLF